MYSVLLGTLLVSMLMAPSMALSCSEQWQCSSVTEDYNYVQCVSGECMCRTDRGFIGDATTSDKCRCADTVYWGSSGPFCKACDPPREIIYQGGNPYCVDGAECEELTEEEALMEVRKQVVREIYENLVYPTPLLIMADHTLATQFSPNVTGRVVPVGYFTDFEGVLEYFYALAANPTSRVVNIFIRTLIGSGNRVGVRVDINFNRTDGSFQNLTQTGFYEFDENNQVREFDVSILNLGAAVDIPDDPVIRAFAIQALCNTLMVSPGTCVGYGEYTDFNDCVTFMSSKEYGSWNRAMSDTVVCRQLHTVLTAIRPEVHCPHAGKTGGGKCIFHAYEEHYTHDYL